MRGNNKKCGRWEIFSRGAPNKQESSIAKTRRAVLKDITNTPTRSKKRSESRSPVSKKLRSFNEGMEILAQQIATQVARQNGSTPPPSNMATTEGQAGNLGRNLTSYMGE
ncbi:hypothetical protein R1sor_021202 [Riccia sorocarpa]|uniref:Uncharacterized protein n=1 Tax=Riccia sorocarpa TaxID=122646 RepID=A0ABD3GHV6_9MARC